MSTKSKAAKSHPVWNALKALVLGLCAGAACLIVIHLLAVWNVVIAAAAAVGTSLYVANAK